VPASAASTNRLTSCHPSDFGERCLRTTIQRIGPAWSRSVYRRSRCALECSGRVTGHSKTGPLAVKPASRRLAQKRRTRRPLPCIPRRLYGPDYTQIIVVPAPAEVQSAGAAWLSNSIPSAECRRWSERDLPPGPWSHELSTSEPTRFTGTDHADAAVPANRVGNMAAVKTLRSPLEENDPASPSPGIAEWDRVPETPTRTRWTGSTWFWTQTPRAAECFRQFGAKTTGASQTKASFFVATPHSSIISSSNLPLKKLHRQ